MEEVLLSASDTLDSSVLELFYTYFITIYEHSSNVSTESRR